MINRLSYTFFRPQLLLSFYLAMRRHPCYTVLKDKEREVFRMGIRKDSIAVAKCMLEAVSEQGTFKNHFTLEYKTFANNFGLSSKQCQLCLEYLEAIGCIRYVVNDKGQFTVLPQIVDFIEDTIQQEA